MHGSWMYVYASVCTYMCTYVCDRKGLSRRKWSPATTGPAGPSMANVVAIDGPAGPSMAAVDGPLCRKWSPPKFFSVHLPQAYTRNFERMLVSRSICTECTLT